MTGIRRRENGRIPDRVPGLSRNPGLTPVFGPRLGRTLLLLFGAIAPALAQWTLNLSIPYPYPSPYVADWQNRAGIVNISIIYTGRGNATARLEMRAVSAETGQLVDGTSAPILFTGPGMAQRDNRDFWAYHDLHYNDRYRQQVVQSGRLLEGSYAMYVRLVDAATGQLLVPEQSRPFWILGFVPPSLLAPPDRDTVSSAFPTLLWTPATMHPGFETRYAVRLCEVQSGQTARAAISNVPRFSATVLNATSFIYPNSAPPLENGKRYVWVVQARDRGNLPLGENEGRSQVFEFAYQPGAGGIPRRPVLRSPLKVTRELERHDNWYRVKLMIQNVGNETLNSITLRDSSYLFQCISDADARKRPPPGSPLPPELFEYEHVPQTVQGRYQGFASVIDADLSQWRLGPGSFIEFRYSALPLLTVTVQGASRTVGAGLKLNWKVEDKQYSGSFKSQAIDDIPGLTAAWKAADYIVLTRPASLYAANPDSSAVDDLLVKLGRLARAKDGALVYLTDAATSAGVVRSVVKALGTALMNNWAEGYLLLVGEDEIVPVWDTCRRNPNRPIPRCDHQYADLNDDDCPELKVGRIIGMTAADLALTVQNSLDVYYHTGNADWTGAKALCLTGNEQPTKGDNFTTHAGQGSQYLHDNKAVDCDYWGQEYITTRKAVLGKALQHTPKSSGGAGTDTTVDNYSEQQLASWLLALYGLLPVGNVNSQYFFDTNGNQRYVPFGFSSSLLATAVQKAEQTENSRRTGWVNQAYGYPASPGDSLAMEFRKRLPNYHAMFFSAHGGTGRKSFNSLTSDVVNTIDFTSKGTRPVIVSFTCFLGDYGYTANSIARALMKRGIGAHIGYGAMTSTAWFKTEVGTGHTFLSHWQKQKRIGDIFYDWKKQLYTDPAYGSDLRMLLGYNLYGDPKFGGN
jgi:hypothetical protein